MFPLLDAGPSLDHATLPAFVVARDGLYLRKRSLLGLSQTKVGRIAHLPEGREFLDYALPKVPADLMARAGGFFRPGRAGPKGVQWLGQVRPGGRRRAVRRSTRGDDPLAWGLRRLCELDRRGRRGGARWAPHRRRRLRAGPPRVL